MWLQCDICKLFGEIRHGATSNPNPGDYRNKDLAEFDTTIIKTFSMVVVHSQDEDASLDLVIAHQIAILGNCHCHGHCRSQGEKEGLIRPLCGYASPSYNTGREKKE